MMKQKQVILFQGFVPTLGELVSRAEDVAALPVDGLVFDVVSSADQNLSRAGWGTAPVRQVDLTLPLQEASLLRTSRPLVNFARFAAQPGSPGFFETRWDDVLTNAAAVAQVAAAAGAAGILLDLEDHPGYSRTFNYNLLFTRHLVTWEEFASKARRCGAELMTALQGSFPAVKVLVPFGYYVSWVYSNEGKVPLADTDYGLLVPFLDGMVSAARGGRVIDGAELTYASRTAAQLRLAVQAIKKRASRLSSARGRFSKVVSVALPVWLDVDWWGFSWRADDLSKNFYSPRQFEALVRAALAQADEVVWVYSARARWVRGPAGEPPTVPPEYVSALRAARGRG